MVSRMTASASLAVLLAGLVSAPAYADPLTISDSLTFVTEDQSMWSPGVGNLVDKPFNVTLIDIDTGLSTLGEIFELSTTITNPLYLAWRTAYNACRLAFSDSVCRKAPRCPSSERSAALVTRPLRPWRWNWARTDCKSPMTWISPPGSRADWWSTAARWT